jgi:hypothetical protein
MEKHQIRLQCERHENDQFCHVHAGFCTAYMMIVFSLKGILPTACPRKRNTLPFLLVWLGGYRSAR